MAEDLFRRRTADLQTAFQCQIEDLLRKGPATPITIGSLNGVAANTIRLLRENKTRSVRREQTEPDTIDFASINAEIDAAIERVLTAKATWPNLLKRASERRSTTAVVDIVDIEDTIESLASLHDSGVLTEEEFRAAVGRVL